MAWHALVWYLQQYLLMVTVEGSSRTAHLINATLSSPPRPRPARSVTSLLLNDFEGATLADLYWFRPSTVNLFSFSRRLTLVVHPLVSSSSPKKTWNFRSSFFFSHHHGMAWHGMAQTHYFFNFWSSPIYSELLKESRPKLRSQLHFRANSRRTTIIY